MFTQKHYQVLANVIYQTRRNLDNPDCFIGDKQSALQTMGEFTAELVKVLKKDNPKFNQFLFIEAACKDLAAKE